MSKRIPGMLLWVAFFSLTSRVRSIAQKPQDSVLFRIIRSGDLAGMKQRLDAGAKLFYLVEHGADIHAKSKTGYTALHYAQMGLTDHPAMTHALLDRGVDPAEKAIDGDSPRSLSPNKGNSFSAQLLNQKN